MSGKPLTFELIYKNETIVITEIHLPSGIHYFIPSDEGLPFFIIKDKESKKWISSPPSHEEPAQKIGALIDEYLANNKPNPGG